MGGDADITTWTRFLTTKFTWLEMTNLDLRFRKGSPWWMINAVKLLRGSVKGSWWENSTACDERKLKCRTAKMWSANIRYRAGRLSDCRELLLTINKQEQRTRQLKKKGNEEVVAKGSQDKARHPTQPTRWAPRTQFWRRQNSPEMRTIMCRDSFELNRDHVVLLAGLRAWKGVCKMIHWYSGLTLTFNKCLSSWGGTTSSAKSMLSPS